jgi:hypothetical protein
MKFVTFFCCILIFSRCAAPLSIINYQAKAPEVFTGAGLAGLFKDTAAPSIMVRAIDRADKNENIRENAFGLIYSAIENVLLKEGFTVRDRTLFNKIASNTGTTDYSKLKDITGTDLILEIINIDPAVVYSTNTITLAYKKHQKKQVQDISYRRYGAEAAYRLIIVKNNEIAGVYKYNYNPCADGCEADSFSFAKKHALQTALGQPVPGERLVEFVSQNIMDMVRSAKAASLQQP